jgi:hypothetical protein
MSTGSGANPPTTTYDEAQEAGYLGAPPDQEPNESYTVEGVTSEATPPPAKSADSGSKSSSSSSKSSS